MWQPHRVGCSCGRASPPQQTRPQRDAFLDGVRLLATLRVLLFHLTEWRWWTALPVIPAMYLIAGSTFELSTFRRSSVHVAFSRLVTIGRAALVYGVAVLAVMLAHGWGPSLTPKLSAQLLVPFLAPFGPGSHSSPGSMLWIHLWFLGTYGISVALAPMLRPALRRSPQAVGVSLLLAWGVAVGLEDLGVVPRPMSNAVVVLALWSLGMYWYATGEDSEHQRTIRCAVIVSIGSGVAWLALRTTSLHDQVSLAAIACISVTLILVTHRFIAEKMHQLRHFEVVGWIVKRSLFIYLWQMIAIFWSRQIWPESSRLQHVCQILIAIALTALCAEGAARLDAHLSALLPFLRDRLRAQPDADQI